MTRLATRLLGAPVALASFVDVDRQFHKSVCGALPEPYASSRQAPLSHSFCQHVVRSGAPLLVDDARSHPLTGDNLAVTELGVLAYAGAPIHAPGGAVLGSFCVVDTEKRYWSEQDLGILTDLAAAVDGEIALRQARREAEAANRAKSRFLANMSHEIRTPMNAVVGVTDLLLRTELDADQRSLVEMIRASGDTLLNVINDILDLSRIEAGKLELDPAPFGLQELLGMLRPLEVKARLKGLSFSVTVGREMPWGFHADKVRIAQILMNLVGNAIKFTNQGGVALTILATPAAGGRTTVLFSVRDTGVGIRPDRLDAVFESFSQEDASTTRRFGGTGLGLTISQDLARLMGGRIKVESEVGVGTTFRAELPLDPLFAPVARPSAPVREEAPARPLRVLLAEDNPVNQLVARRMLEGDGHTVVLADEGRQALAAMESGSFDVILMDIQMPGLDGLEVTRIWREREREKGGRAAIVALTAHAMEEHRQQALEVGMDGYLTKPMRLEELRSTLAAYAPAAGVAREGTPLPGPQSAGGFNRDRFLAAVDGDEELLVEIAQIWVEQAAPMLAAVQAAVDGGDALALENAAHRMKGSALTVGAERLAAVAGEMERMGREGVVGPEWGEAATRLRATVGEVERVMAAIAEGR